MIKQIIWKTSLLKLPMVLILLVATSACVTQFRNHGFIPNDDELAGIIIGVDTKDSLEASIGRPNAAGIADQSGWYFVRSKFRHLGALEPKEIDRQVVAISFDDSGLVANVERFGIEQGQVVALSRRVTEKNVQGVTFLQQIFGNFGQISPNQLIQ